MFATKSRVSNPQRGDNADVAAAVLTVASDTRRVLTMVGGRSYRAVPCTQP